MHEEEKEKDLMIKELKEEVQKLKLQCLDEQKYEEWNHEEIAAWIMGLDEGRFVKYEKTVKRNLKEEEVEGSMLSKVDGADLKRWGITKFMDFKYLLQQIESLVAKTVDNESKESKHKGMDSAANVNEGAPTAYH